MGTHHRSRWFNGSTSEIFQAVTDWIPSTQVAEARVSFEVLAFPGGKDIRVAGGYQTADEPTGSVTNGSAIGDFTNTTTYGGEFTAAGQTMSYTRLGLFVKNNASTDLNVGSVAVRIEYRD